MSEAEEREYIRTNWKYLIKTKKLGETLSRYFKKYKAEEKRLDLASLFSLEEKSI